MKVFLATLIAALAAPAAAFAATPTLTVRDVPLAGSRSLAVSIPHFDMVAVHWRGPGRVQVQTRSTAGVWSAWQTADDDVAPDWRSGENRLASWRLGSPVWTGEATAARFRTLGRVIRLRAYTIASPVEATLSRRLTIANAPPIIPRLSWGADESIRRANPQYAPAIHFAVVHHTAGTNDYSPAQSAAIVRGIEVYHVKGNGWNDIGYNFLVDKYGQVFEGRYGGVDKAVVGAHSLGFNDGSVGVAVIGDFGSSQVTAAAKRSLEQLLAWRLDVAHVDPLSTITWLSGGNPRFPTGLPVILRAISGHRDTNYTDCPGNALYAQLPQIAKDVTALGGPKLYAPLATRVEGAVRFTGRLSAALPWTVTVTDAAGVPVAQGSGSSATVDWTWDATTVVPQKYVWAIAAPGVRAAAGTIGAGTAATALAFQKVTATPSLLAPGGSPTDDTMTVAYTLTAAATVTAAFVDAKGQVLSTVFAEPKAAGAQSFTFSAAPGLFAGAYAIQLAAATTDGKTASVVVPFTIDDTLDGFASAASVFSPARHATTSISFTLSRLPVSLQLQVTKARDASAVVANPPLPPLAVGANTLTWDGLLDDGTVAPDGRYTLALTVTDAAATFTKRAIVTVDSSPPKVTALSYRLLRFRVSEPASITLAVGDAHYTRTTMSAATLSFWLKTKPTAYRLIVTDTAGNTSIVRYRRP